MKTVHLLETIYVSNNKVKRDIYFPMQCHNLRYYLELVLSPTRIFGELGNRPILYINI